MAKKENVISTNRTGRNPIVVWEYVEPFNNFGILGTNGLVPIAQLTNEELEAIFPRKVKNEDD